MRKIVKRSNCPISYTMDFFGDKWTFLIIRDVALKGKCFYKEFLEAGEGIATNVLSDRLKMLELEGIIRSEKYEKVKTMKKYSLTEKGKSLIPILIDMIIWGGTYDKNTDAPKEFVKKAIEDRKRTIQSFLDSLE
ncbi:winged helix-turn-helix transcriptional regulator [Aquimarina sediminis]|uniref:winged helix-turn-helix transcriptional regulator n=1 Tax=Aquimarina sediminis TaxID=2070536 RepID=UPI000CA04032|nr:helix-turn-helix domain-containing protein [Aquimarina sediminis]